MNNIKIIKLDPRVDVPTRATIGSAGFDLQAAIAEPVYLFPGESKLIPTGLKIHIDNNKIVACLVPRSKNGAKGLVIGNLIGIIDSDYQGQWFVNCWNRNKVEPYGLTNIEIRPLDKIAQVVFLNLAEVSFDLVDSFETITDRADGGISKQEDTSTTTNPVNDCTMDYNRSIE